MGVHPGVPATCRGQAVIPGAPPGNTLLLVLTLVAIQQAHTDESESLRITSHGRKGGADTRPTWLERSPWAQPSTRQLAL